MDTFNWKKGIGSGAVIWLILFAFVSLLVGVGAYGSVGWSVIAILLAGALSYVFGLQARPVSMSQALAYGLSWAVVGIILDVIVTMRFDPSVFSSWEYWVSYALILLAPTLCVKGESVQKEKVV